jgi:drug/metabolite transporter (DMT)-like permease
MVAAIRSHWAMGVVTSLMAMLGYGIALWAMTRMPIGVVGAVRETSVLFATVIAAVFLRERFGRARVAAAIAIVGGLIAIQSG